MLRKLQLKLRMLFHRKRAGSQLNDELSYHLDRQIAENIAAGMTPAAARRAALRTFGNPGLIREEARAHWSWTSLELLLRDLRLSFRSLQRAPAFTVIAVLVMALGLGANIAIFAVVHSVLLNPLPYRDPGSLVALYSHDRIPPSGNNFYIPIDAGSFYAWQQAAQDMAQMSLISPFQNYNVSAEGGRLPEKVDAAWVSASFFPTLGVPPILGRGFSASDDRPEAEATAILSYSFWKTRYNGDRAVLGHKVWLDSRPYLIVGVMPQSFVFLGPYSSGKIKIWTPASHEAPRWLMQTFEDHEFVAVARLNQGVTLASLLDRLDTVQQHIRVDHPSAGVRSVTSGRPLLDDAVPEYKTPLYVLFAATGCVLLIASLNVASLLVARTATRRKELAVRTALGGGILRLLRERVLESLLLTAGGGILGTALAALAIRWLAHARPDISRVENIHLDGAVLLFTLGSVTFCALFSGLISALSINSRQILHALQESTRSQSGNRSQASLRRVLLILEVSLTVVLLIGAGLLLKSYSHLRATDIGISTANTLTLNVSLPDARYKTPAAHIAFYEQFIERVRALPGVSSAGLVSAVPGMGWGGDRLISVVEHPPLPKGTGIDMMVRGADPGYFSAVGLPIMKGRTFNPDEHNLGGESGDAKANGNAKVNKDHVILLSQAAVKACFPDGDDPIGRHIKINMGGDIYQIIGIVADTRYDITFPAMATMYMPLDDYGGTSIVVRSSHDVESLAIPIQKVVGSLDPDLPVSGVMTLQQSLALATIGSGFDSLLVFAFAIIALVLASVGLFGVLSYIVTQRTSELGLRIALGAQRNQVLRLVLLDGLKPALIGLITGLAVSFGLARFIESMLHGIEPRDPAIFTGVSLTLLLVAVIACLIPAWHASRLDPMKALRTE
jgi:predicted permease